MSFTIKRMLYSSFPQTYLLNKINWYNLDTFSNLIPQVSFISNSFYDEEENISSLLSKLLENNLMTARSIQRNLRNWRNPQKIIISFLH